MTDTMTDTQQRIISWIVDRQADVKGEKVEVSSDTDLLTSGLLDSLDFMHLMTFLENEYNVEIPIDLLAPDNFSTPEVAGKLVDGIVNQ